MLIGERSGNEVLWANAAAVHGCQLVMCGRVAEGVALCERAWNTADAAGHQVPAFMATVVLCGLHCFFRRDPEAARRSAERELASSRAATSPIHQDVLRSALAYGLVLGGALDRARSVGPPPRSAQFHAQYLLALAEGRWEEGLEVLEHSRARARQSGNRWFEAADSSRIAELLRLLGRHAEAEVELLSALPRHGEQNLPHELRCRCQLSLVLAETGRSEQAREQLARCRAIVAGGEDWGGAATALDLAEASILATDGRMGEATHLFSEAVDGFRRQGLPWDVAEAHQLHGRALLAQGGPARVQAIVRFDAALDALQLLEAGERWHLSVLADRDRATTTAGPVVPSFDVLGSAEGR
jgi:tetratricopeptide (TPR) repeat protein